MQIGPEAARVDGAAGDPLDILDACQVQDRDILVRNVAQHPARRLDDMRIAARSRRDEGLQELFDQRAAQRLCDVAPRHLAAAAEYGQRARLRVETGVQQGQALVAHQLQEILPGHPLRVGLVKLAGRVRQREAAVMGKALAGRQRGPVQRLAVQPLHRIAADFIYCDGHGSSLAAAAMACSAPEKARPSSHFSARARPRPWSSCKNPRCAFSLLDWPKACRSSPPSIT